MKLYVEGGGQAAALKTACREGFQEFITKAGLNKRPRVVACGSRKDAYDSFCTAIANGDDAMLLVDSEEPVSEAHQKGDDFTGWLPWEHLKQRDGDGWEAPEKSRNDDCHLMVQVMENWLLADRDCLTAFYGNGFKENQLPAATRAVEGVTKADAYRTLKNATAACKTKSAYSKGEHSFKLLGLIDPAKVVAGSRWARRFINELKKKMNA